MKLTLHIWRQKNAHSQGRMVQYEVTDVEPEMSFLEMLDVLNERLISQGEEPIAFDSDCREGICGTCEQIVLEGEVDHRDSVLDEEEQEANECMMVCVSRARSARLVLDA